MKKIDDYKLMSSELLEGLSGGATSTRCKLAIATCAHDTILGALGTSNPGSSCAYMRKVCK